MSELSDNEFNKMLSGFNKQTGIEKTYTEADLQREKLELLDEYKVAIFEHCDIDTNELNYVHNQLKQRIRDGE